MKSRFFQAEEGSITYFGIFLLINGVLLGGLAVDSANAWMHKQRLQATADAAALAAARYLPDVPRARREARALVEENLPVETFGETIRGHDIRIGRIDHTTGAFIDFSEDPSVPATTVQVVTRNDSVVGNQVRTFLLNMIGMQGWDVAASAVATRVETEGGCSGGPLLGGLSDYLFFFANGRTDANWQAASPGYVGNVAVNGQIASERSSGTFEYSGEIVTNASSLGGWERILSANSATATVSYLDQLRIDSLLADFDAAVSAIRSMPVTAGYENVHLSSLNNLDTRDGRDTTYVINVTGWDASAVVNIWGDAGDAFVMRWDTNPATPPLEGIVKFQSGGGINPLGDLMPTSFLNLAGDINASGGGSVPSGLVQSVNLIPGNVDAGGFFTGYWLTLGDPNTRETQPLSNARFLGGWFTNSVKFSMTSGTAGARIAPPQAGLLSPCQEPADAFAGERSRLLR